MSHCILPNQSLYTANEIFAAAWATTRAMLGAGYEYKASSDATGTGTTKDTTGNMVFDRWGVGGNTNTSTVPAQTGAAASISAATAGISTVTGLTGMVTNSVGRFLTISGCANASNNGTFRIVAYTSASSVNIYHPGATLDANNAALSWTELYGGAAASIGTPSAGRVTITGLTGMVSPTASNRGSVGNRLTITGAATGANNGTFMIVKVNSSTSVDIKNTSAASDVNNGSIQWTEMSPTLQSIPSVLMGSTGIGAWVCLQGVSMMKIPIGTSNPTGYIRGENVTQTSTGAQGELIGIIPDVNGGLGFALIAPRVSGSSAGTLRGWSCSGGATDNITGSVSGVIITPFASGTVAEFVQEFVFWKATAALNGHIYAQCVDTVAENTSRFSTQAALSQCTNVICPGGASSGVVTTNGFPTIGTFTILGTGGSGSAGTGSNSWNTNSASTTYGKYHCRVANTIEETSVTADGTWSFEIGFPTTSPQAYTGITYQRLDDCEEGDIWPYASGTPHSSGTYTGNRVAQTSNSSNSGDVYAAAVFCATNTAFRGWRRRGFPTGDAFQDFGGQVLATWNGTIVMNQNIGTPDKVATTVVSVNTREPIWVVSTQLNRKMRKGSCRWLAVTMGLNGNDTLDGKKLIQLSSRSDGGLASGPWDTTTTPVNSLWLTFLHKKRGHTDLDGQRSDQELMGKRILVWELIQ